MGQRYQCAAESGVGDEGRPDWRYPRSANGSASGLELHPDKTRIVYCQDANRRETHPDVQFTFLGYTFRPRKAVDKYQRVYVNFSPAVSRDALKAMRQTIRGWHLQLKCDRELHDLAAIFNPVLRGWQQYYGRFYGSAMSVIWKHMNDYLVRWMMRKYKTLAREVGRQIRTPNYAAFYMGRHRDLRLTGTTAAVQRSKHTRLPAYAPERV